MGRYLVAGLGLTGKSVLNYLLKRKVKKIYIFDDKVEKVEKELPENTSGKVEIVKNAEQVKKINFDFIIPSPGIPPHHPIIRACLEMGKEFLTDISIFAGEFKGIIIGVSGTNGKTTVTEMIYHIFKNSGARTFLGGNIGVPALDGLSEEFEFAILELSSFQLHYSSSLSLHTAVLTNISPDHLDWHGSFEHYIVSKTEWLRRVKNSRIFFLDDEEISRRFGGDDIKDFPVSTKIIMNRGCFLLPGEYMLMKNGRNEIKVDTRGFSFHGIFNYLNAGFSALAGYLYSIPVETIVKSLENFPLPYGRLSPAGEIKGIVFYDDSKATNPHATLHALLSMKKKCVLMLGGLNKNLPFKPLRDEIERKCHAVIFFGKDGKKILEELNLSIPHSYFPHFREAFEGAVEFSFKYGADLLLSPGCASFDEFEGYAHRSRVFRELVKKLMEEKGGEKS